jgi:hypothetical protein
MLDLERGSSDRFVGVPRTALASRHRIGTVEV